MKIALMADIHGNNVAFQAVLDHINRPNQKGEMQKIDQYWFLGDMVGRGPDPEGPLQWFLTNNRQTVVLIGNHEVLLAKKVSSFAVDRVGLVTSETIDIHRRLPLIKKWIKDEVLLHYKDYEKPKIPSKTRDLLKELDAHLVISHASYEDPLGIHDGYIYSWDAPTLEKEFMELCKEKAKGQLVIKCFGHSHVPTLVASARDGQHIDPYKVRPFLSYKMSTDRLWLLNPGSIGSPRDLDPRASYAILEIAKGTAEVTFFKVAYDWSLLRDQLSAKNYPNKTFALYFENAYQDQNTDADWINHYKNMKEVYENE